MARVAEYGRGRPIILVPGIQGRWEWQQPTVLALAAFARVLTFSLGDEPSSGCDWAAEDGFENYLRQLRDVVALATDERPILVGISYGGLIAAEFAARHPTAIAGLVLVSAPPPGWTLPARAQRYLRAPRLMAPLFWLGAPFRTYPELSAAFSGRPGLWQFLASQGRRIAAARPSSARMVRRLRWLAATTFSIHRGIKVPALIVTGEPGLDRVVPPEATRQYVAWIAQARIETLARTGHAGTITRAGDFARLVEDFVNHNSGSLRADRVS